MIIVACANPGATEVGERAVLEVLHPDTPVDAIASVELIISWLVRWSCRAAVRPA
jgi:hypothetical protein